MRWLLITAALALPACESVSAGIAAAKSSTAQGIENVKTVNDGYARVAVRVPCSMTVGAFFRLADARQREGVEMLCGENTPADEGLSAADLEKIEMFYDLLDRSRAAVGE